MSNPTTIPTTIAEKIARDDVDDILIETFSLTDYPETAWRECAECAGVGEISGDNGEYECLACEGEGEVEYDAGASPADSFREDEAGCSYRTRDGHVWMSPALIADLMDRAYAAGKRAG